MKATLEYNLPQDDYEHRLAVHSAELYHVLFDVRGVLRGYKKHADLEGMTADQLIERVWSDFNDIAGHIMETVEG